MPGAAFVFGQLTLHVPFERPFGSPFGSPFDGSRHTPFDGALNLYRLLPGGSRSPKRHAKATNEPRGANCPASVLRVERGLQLIE
ncbi:hypothetical protein SAMN04487926_125109 [Paraburkholderia steynii]|uniref:Uncharacterized protein n=1 Tax=Paraburkholderia steynii TaxID=1245441 RepID=A0A7Z7FME5_9BURK|nr:hypothetical protein SAMN04487926_125109 [Paraburkholderia steynii]